MSPASGRRRRRRRTPAAQGRTAAGRTEAAGAPPGRRSRSGDGRDEPRRGGRAERPIDDRPPAAPWGSFPLVELVVLLALVMLIAGLLLVGGTRGGVMIGAGLALGSLAGLELAIREHFAGYRSHTLILAAFPAAVALGLLFYLGPAGLPQLVRLAAAALVFGLAALGLTTAFRRRSGGLNLRVRGFRG